MLPGDRTKCAPQNFVLTDLDRLCRCPEWGDLDCENYFLSRPEVDRANGPRQPGDDAVWAGDPVLRHGCSRASISKQKECRPLT